MQVEKIQMLVEKGEFSKSKEFQEIRSEVLLAIEAVDWFDKGKFIINPTKKGNGVKLIKNNFIETLKQYSWRTEITMQLVEGVGPGAIDAIKNTHSGLFAVEWETGNISSSHRALNKLAIAVLHKQIIGGFLVVPVRQLSIFLTDRIGNYEELRGYFPLYRSLRIKNGAIGIIGVTYDGISSLAPLIPKGNDGNSKISKEKYK